MTFEEFKSIATRKLPQIEAMVSKVQELGAHSINAQVNADGFIDFNIDMKNEGLYFSATHTQ